MAKANLILPDGTKVKIDGSAEEVASLISKLSQPSVTQHKKTKPKRKKGGKLKTKAKRPSIVRELDLSKNGSTPSIRDFYQKYAPKTNLERNLLFCYYLQNLKNVKPITIDHVYTCYRNIQELKIPKNLYQSLVDTSRLKGWIDTSSMYDISVEIAGINYMEHDMPKSESK